MSEHLRMTIAHKEPDEKGWIVARVVDPSALSRAGRARRHEKASSTLCG
jgi:hypothetical protein